jgi:predicted RNA-binding protein YlqC (UPF0109 family)
MADGSTAVVELLDYIVRNLVDDPQAVAIVEKPGRRVTVYEVSVARGDWGKVIGKEGRIANAIRTVAKAAAATQDEHIAVEIMT